MARYRTPGGLALRVPPGAEEDVSSGRRDVLLLPASSEVPPRGERVRIESDRGPVAEGEVAWVEDLTLREALASLGGRVVLDPRHVTGEGGRDPMEERFTAVGLKRITPLLRTREEQADLPDEFLTDLSVCSSCPFRGSC
ncbi:MAG TPA: hypothetical protein ENF83_03300 [Candidatus Korarchaeota archaeon]|nr:hypothetical protein [Candidatus Korarchaeota archaeon]